MGLLLNDQPYEDNAKNLLTKADNSNICFYFQITDYADCGIIGLFSINRITR